MADIAGLIERLREGVGLSDPASIRDAEETMDQAADALAASQAQRLALARTLCEGTPFAVVERAMFAPTDGEKK